MEMKGGLKAIEWYFELSLKGVLRQLNKVLNGVERGC